MVTAGPPPLTILQPGEGLTAPERGNLGMIGVAFELQGMRLSSTGSRSAL
jgi:hypothetical protein